MLLSEPGASLLVGNLRRMYDLGTLPIRLKRLRTLERTVRVG